MGRLSGDARLEGGDLLLTGPAVDAGDGGGDGARREGHGADLVDGDVVQAARDIAPGGLHEGVEHGRAQARRVLRQGVGQAHRVAARVVGGDLEHVVHVADEGVGQHLGEAGVGQGAHHVAAGDLLDEVGGADQVGPPGGRGDGEQLTAVGLIDAGGLHGAADGLQ